MHGSPTIVSANRLRTLLSLRYHKKLFSAFCQGMSQYLCEQCRRHAQTHYLNRVKVNELEYSHSDQAPYVVDLATSLTESLFLLL